MPWRYTTLADCTRAWRFYAIVGPAERVARIVGPCARAAVLALPLALPSAIATQTTPGYAAADFGWETFFALGAGSFPHPASLLTGPAEDMPVTWANLVPQQNRQVRPGLQPTQVPEPHPALVLLPAVLVLAMLRRERS